MDKYLNKLIMYHEIQRLYREGHSVNYISEFLVLNWRTVKKYLSMDEYAYQDYITGHENRKKELGGYQEFVKLKLEKYQSTSASQMHDWLKEHYQNFPDVSAKTVYNFVMWVRQKHHLPKIAIQREYALIDELPYGKQAQVDFGEYNIRGTDGKRTKVYFFAMVLSRSRYKYIYFSNTSFTTHLSILAHEKAFAFFNGIPKEVVYDQDSVFMANENYGDLQLAKGFGEYIKQRGFGIYFCRKADPETKGKIENVVKYVKQNFLYSRPYTDIDTLNTEAIAWLNRTANHMEHGKTKRRPKLEWDTEQAYLNAYQAMQLPLCESKKYTVRKDNSLSFKSNLYTLPQGTWIGNNTMVTVDVKDGFVIIGDENGNEICRHKKHNGKGETIANTDHRRDKSQSIDKLIETTALMFEDARKAKIYLGEIRELMPRYTRDQVKVIQICIEQYDAIIITKTLDYCIENKIFSAADFKAIAEKEAQKKTPIPKVKTAEIKPINNHGMDDGALSPDTSKIADYENLIMN